MSDTVKKQHYIWREYLTRWTDSGDRFNGKLFVLRKLIRGKQERIEFCKLQNIGFEKYYYDVTGFQEKDKIILEQFLAHMQEKELVKIGIEPKIFSEAAEQRDFIEKRIMCPYENIDNKWNFLDKLSNGDFSFYRESKRQIVLDKLQKCMVDSILFQENQLSNEEIINMVSEFFQEDSEEDDLKYEFHRFFCMQYFRSPRIRNDTVANIEELKKEREELKDLDTNFYVNMVATYFAERMALNITQNFSTSILLFENKTDVPFETDDNVLYRVTQSGYNASDDLEKQIGTEKVRCNNCHYHGASDKKNKCPICNCEIGGREEIILDAIRKDSTVTRKQLSELLSCSEQTVLNVLNSLSEKGIIERVSSNRGASWKIK